MGFNSVLMILNDAYDVIDKDPVGWWAKAKHELTALRGDSPKSFGFGNHCNPTEAVVCHHADVTSLIAVGGNHSTVLCSIHNGQTSRKRRSSRTTESCGREVGLSSY